MKGIVNLALVAAGVLTAGQIADSVKATEKLELRVSPAISLAPASVSIRAIVEHDADNRELEIVADSSDFFRRTVIDLDGEHAPKTTELRLIDIPGGEYEIRATVLTAQGTTTTVRRSVMVMSQNVK